jgi:hypothetical protein
MLAGWGGVVNDLGDGHGFSSARWRRRSSLVHSPRVAEWTVPIGLPHFGQRLSLGRWPRPRKW